MRGLAADEVANLGSSAAEKSARTREVMKTFFAPYDDPIQQDLGLIREVSEHNDVAAAVSWP